VKSFKVLFLTHSYVMIMIMTL